MTPIDMILHCPKCGMQHIDREEGVLEHQARIHQGPYRPGGRWLNPPHRSHLCLACGCIWRPADVPTNGVLSITTRGAADNWPAA